MASQIPKLPIPPQHKDLFTTLTAYVQNYMSAYDMSHDYTHILRVLSNAHRILLAEQAANPSVSYDPTTLYFAALLHDVGDKKYTAADEDPDSIVHNVLVKHGADEAFAKKIQKIITHISYTYVTKNPSSVAAVLAEYPELGIVQDADRLDAIGAVGVARCFAFTAAKRPGESLGAAIEHFGEKLVKLPGLMKTGKGREMAERRGRVIEEFRREWEGEVEFGFGLE